MLKFDISQGVAVIDASTITMIPELNKLYKKYKKNTVLRDRIFTYLHVVAKLDPSAPFFGADSSEIEELARNQYFDEKVPFPVDDNDNIQQCLKLYIKAFERPEVRILKLFDDKIDQIKKVIDDTNPDIKENINPTTGVTSYTTNIEIITKALEKIDGLLITKDKLEAKIRNESEGKGSVRGKKKPSMLERKAAQKAQTVATDG